MTTSDMDKTLSEYIDTFYSTNTPFQFSTETIRQVLGDLFTGMKLADCDCVNIVFEKVSDKPYKVKISDLTIERTLLDSNGTRTHIVPRNVQKLIGDDATCATLSSTLENLISNIADAEYGEFLRCLELTVRRIQRNGFVAYHVFYEPFRFIEKRHGAVFLVVDTPPPQLNGGW